MEAHPKNDLTDSCPSRYPLEPFKNFKVQFDEFGKSMRVEFKYQGTDIVFRTKVQPSFGHGAYGWSDSGSENMMGNYSGVPQLGESYMATVFRHILVEAEWLHKKSGRNGNTQDDESHAPFNLISEYHDKSDVLTPRH